MAVSFTVEIGFDSSAATALGSVSWTDVTADVRAWSINRGRQSELSTYSAGSASVTLDNRSRTYDPSNTAGSYYGKILPRRRLRITLTAGAVTAAIFTGYVADWSMEWPEQGIDSTVTVSATDAFEVLSTLPQPGSAYAGEVLTDGPIGYWPLQSAQSLVDVVNNEDMMVVASVEGVLSADESGTLPLGASVAMTAGRARAEFVSSLADTPLTVEAWVSVGASYAVDSNSIFLTAAIDGTHYSQLMAYRDSSNQFGFRMNFDNGTIKSQAVSFESAHVGAGLVHVAATISGSSVLLYLNGVLVYTQPTTATVGSAGVDGTEPRFNITIEPGSSASHFAVYDSTLTAARILAHYEAGIYAYGHPYGEQTGTRVGRILTAASWPTADREITDPGATVVGQWLPAEASALAGCRECETAEQGAFFINAAGQATFRSRNQLLTLARCITSQATFGDDAAETPVTNPLQVDGTNLDYTRNAVTVTYQGGTVTTSDETSISAYGTLDDSVSAGLLDTQSGWVARQLAAYRLRLRKTPVSRVPAVKAQLLDDLETHLAEVIPLELCDRVTVNRRPSGGTGSFSQQCHIQGIRWGWSPAQSYAWQAYLSPAVPSYSTADYLLIGDATYGKVGSTHTAVY